MNSETLCELCSHTLSSPTILACCYSSVCLDCLKKISVKETRGTDKLIYKCPFCNKERQSYTSAKSNTFLARYIEFCYKSGKLQSLQCGNCQDIVQSCEATLCKDCDNKYFCKECNVSCHSEENKKSHNRMSINNVIRNYTGNLNKPMLCSSHFREKIEFICLKDLSVLCKTCVVTHKRNCKENKIVSLGKAHGELVSQITSKMSQTHDVRNMAEGEYTTVQKKLEDFNRNSEDIISTIEYQFQELREILNTKETEIKAHFTQIISERKNILTQEVQGLEKINSKTESLIDVVEFAMSYPNSFFSEGAKYLMQRLNRLSEYALKIESARATQIPNFEIANIEDCRTALEELTLKEIRNIAQPKPTSRSKSIAVKIENTLCPDAVISPLSPKLENYSILQQDAKKKIAHMKKFSLTSSYSNLLPLHRMSMSPDGKMLSKQKSFSKLSLGITSCRNILSQFDSLKEQKENNVSKTEAFEPIKLPKERTEIAAPSLTHSRRPSKSPNFKSSSLRSWAESSKLRITSSEDLASYNTLTLCLSPHSKEENLVISEEDLELIAEVRKDPLVKRKFLKASQTATSIFVSWQHCNEASNIIYQLDYGVGSKVQSIEQFRTAFKGTENSFMITGLSPKTTYRLRVCAIIAKENSIEEDINFDISTCEETVGSWSDIISITTKDVQAIDPESLGTHATTTSPHGKETIVDFEKSGRVITKNEYEYGKIAWEIRIPQHIAHQAPVDSNSFIKVGVTNKNGKTYNIVGSLINYGLSTDSMVIKVFLDMDNRSMIVYTSHNKTKEVFNNLPIGPLYPVFQNKTSKDSNCPLKLNIKFDLPYTSNDIKDLE